MNIEKKIYNVSVKATRKFQSVSITEGFEVTMDKDYDEFQYESFKQMIKDKLIVEARQYLDNVVDTIDVNLE